MTSRVGFLLGWAGFAIGYSAAYLIGGLTAGHACRSRTAAGCDIATYWEPLDDNRAWGWLPFWAPLFGLIAINTILITTRRYRIALLLSGVAIAWLVIQAVLAHTK